MKCVCVCVRLGRGRRCVGERVTSGLWDVCLC